MSTERNAWPVSAFLAGPAGRLTHRLSSIALVLAAVLFSACSSIHLYDPARDTAARNAVEQKQSAGLDSVAATSAETLDELLKNELDLAAGSHDFLYQLDIFEIAAGSDDDASLLHSIEKIDSRLRALGYPDRAAVLAESDALRNYGAAVKNRDLAVSSIELIARADQKLPPCTLNMPIEWPESAAAAEDTEAASVDEIAVIVQEEYDRYRAACLRILTIVANSRGVVALVADIEFNEHERQKQKKAAAERGAAIKKLKSDIAKANESGMSPSNAIADLENHVAELRKQQNAFDIEILSEESLASIETVLTYIAGEEEGDKLEVDGELLAAAEMLREATSLADAAAELIDKSRQPPVAHLVLELNRQLLLKDFAARLIQLDARKQDYTVQLAQVTSEQAAAYRQFVNDLCRFGLQSPASCDTLEYDANAGLCEIPDVTNECGLVITWQDALKVQGQRKRYVLGAIVALTKSHRAAKRASELEYRINDIAHRRALLESESAIAQWQNLLDIPAEQVAAFYAAGVKPEEFGDFLVKALALAGIVAIAED